ncbi:GNAT family N-acetyltransferase [Amycolatopsis orientalis]|uniref:GNAT family N-acetyltransferase n=1 Tax=Amycolatopsis orientalis TaxID=31958 RepID=UPI00041AD05E|nr:GNAT family N-acetyltransferase [Amycolatopsis orientalis]
MKIRLHDPRTDPVPVGWTEFVPAARLHPVWDYEVMGLDGWTARNPPMLVTIADGAGILAALSVLVCRPRLRPRFAPTPGHRLLRPFWAEVCQPWLSGYPGLVFAPRVAAAERRPLIREFERALRGRLGPGLLGVLYRALGEEFAKDLRGPGRLVKHVDSVAVLENRFGSEDEWIASLPKSRRGGLRRQRRRLAADPDLVVKGGPGREDVDSAEVAALIQAHRERHGRLALDSRTMPSAAFLRRFLRRPDVHTLTYTGADGRLLAVNTLLDHPDSPAKQHWGTLPVTEGGRQGLLFDSYIHAMRYATRRGVKELTAGRGLPELKATLGFRARPVYTAAVPRPVLGW